MFEVLLGVGLGLLIALNVALWLKLDRCYHDLHKMISDVEFNTPILDGIDDLIQDSVGNIMSNLHVPTASDHFIGGLSQIMQMWAMKKFSPMINEMQDQLEMPQVMPEVDPV
tara:strand:+ start:2178 stop:2513 length:336 start_codon:yes stop_codon:yes gene_type:complete